MCWNIDDIENGDSIPSAVAYGKGELATLSTVMMSVIFKVLTYSQNEITLSAQDNIFYAHREQPCSPKIKYHIS